MPTRAEAKTTSGRTRASGLCNIHLTRRRRAVRRTRLSSANESPSYSTLLSINELINYINYINYIIPL